MKFTLKGSPLVTFNSLAQFSHVGWGYIFVSAPTLLIGQRALWWAFGITVLGAGIKEYWDAHGLEDPITAGDSWEDFGFWCGGVTLALGVLLFRR